MRCTGKHHPISIEHFKLMIEKCLTGFSTISRMIPLDLSTGCPVTQSGMVKRDLVIGAACIVVGGINITENDGSARPSAQALKVNFRLCQSEIVSKKY